jgi:hypothetical protein
LELYTSKPVRGEGYPPSPTIYKKCCKTGGDRMRELGTIEFAYTLKKGASMKEVFAYSNLLNRFIDDRLGSMGVSPGRVRIESGGIQDGKIRYILKERHI